MNDYQITKLKKELQRKQQLLKEEKQDHRQTQDRLVKIQAERDRFYNELIINRQTIEKVDGIMAEKMKEIKIKLEEQNADSLSQLQKLKDQLVSEKILREKVSEQIKNKDSVISQLSLRLKEMSRKYKDPSLLVNTKQLSQQATVTNNNYYKLTQKYNKVCSDLQNIMAENKILRKLHGVPENFGFDLQEIKIAEKQELQDYKAQCRKLQTQIEQLEEERTQLRYRLRQFHSLYSNKGQRYKDLSNQQLELLDQFALNLKEGKVQLPQMDKTHKEMQREIIKLKAQIEILQSKATPQFVQRNNNNNNQESQNADRLPVQAIRKLEDQFAKLINPLRDDLKRITDQGIKTVQVIRQPQNKGYRDQAVNQGPEFRPPMPLPIAHNDWSQIKEGFSYMYGSKIPINLKDVSDEGGFSVAKAKYEVAALQLQNIESLKLVKQKQVIQRKLMKQVEDIRAKYQKCVRVQDQLFLRYFKQKEERNEKMRRLQIEKSNIQSEKRQVQVNLGIVTESFNALTKKTDLQKKNAQLTSRLAISESQLLKLTRKYQVLQEQSQILRNSYTSLQSKTAASQFALKEKLSYAKKSQKQLTFYLRKILEEARDSVGGDVHKALLGKMQVITDRNVSSSIKETQLRVRINQLENIEREINLKDDIIQTLRDDNFDLILQLQIIKNRLESSDGDYRQFQQIFRRLTQFINKNNVSLSTYFRKFDKDGSGQLGKTEFISAIKALGFTISNNQFQLLFSEFDLDGSQSITYRQFLRKMRRSGVLTRNSEEDALYRLFKAIKQANISIRKAFQIIDKDGSNQISKTEMESAFRHIGIDVATSTIDYIFKVTDRDMTGTINCNQFEKLFQDIIRESAIEEKQVFGTEMDWKLMFVLKMEEVSTKYYKGGLKQTFSTLDNDGSSCLTLNELTQFFKKAGIDLPRKELLELFQYLDRHRDGKVQYIQFLKVLEEAKQEKKRLDRIKYIKARTQQLRRENQGNIKQSVGKAATQEKTLNVKLMSLESKHSSLLKKNEKLIKGLVNKEQENAELKKQVQDLQKIIQKIRTDFYSEKQANIALQQKMKNRISAEQSKKILIESNKKDIELLDAKNNLELYKNLYQDLSTRNRYDQMTIAKVQSQLNKYYQIVKNFQSLTDINAELGKKVYELQVSKRNQEVVNKKYQNCQDQMRAIQAQNQQLSEQNTEKEREIVNAHFFFQQKSQLLQRTIDQLNSRILPTLNPEKVDEILIKIREISNSKTQLQKENKQIRQLNFNLQVRNDYIENEKVHIQELQKKLRRTYTDESSLTIIDLTKKLSQYKMGELKAKRESSLLKEKEEYYLRVNNNQTQNIKQIEAELANWQKKFNQRQEFWRKRLADQIKLMEQLQNEAKKTKQQQRNAEKYFSQQNRQEKVAQQKFENLPEEKQSKLSSLLRRNNNSSSQNNTFELKSKIQQLQEQLLAKQKQIYQLKSTFKQIVPEAKFNDYAGQMSASTTNFLMQTQLTTSQLRNNARRFINNQKDQEEYYREEALKITQAAQQSIDTLQRIIDDKNDQLKRKEHLIESLKKEFLKNKEDDCRQIQLLNQEIRQLKTRVQTASLNEVMGRTTNKNFRVSSKSDEVFQLRQVVQKKQEQIKMLQQRYDKLFILKQKKGQEMPSNQRRAMQQKIDQLLDERQVQKKKYLENEERLNLKIKNLQKLSKQKDLKLSKLQKTLIDLKNMAVNEAVVKDNFELEEQMKDAIINMTKGKTANESKMQMTMQKSLQAVQDLTKKNKEYQQEVRRLKEEKLTKTTFKK